MPASRTGFMGIAGRSQTVFSGVDNSGINAFGPNTPHRTVWPVAELCALPAALLLIRASALLDSLQYTATICFSVGLLLVELVLVSFFA